MQETLDRARPDSTDSDIDADTDIAGGGTGDGGGAGGDGGDGRPERVVPRPRWSWVLGLAAVALLCGEVLYRGATGGTAALGLVALAWVASVGPTNRWRPDGWLPVGTVAALAAWLPFRSSPTVDGFLIAACLLVIVFGPSSRRWSQLAAVRRFHWLDRLIEQLVAVIPTPSEQSRLASLRKRGPSLSLSGINPLGALCSLTFGLVLIALLRDGDAVFDSLLTGDVNLEWLGPVVPRAMTTLFAGTFAAWLLIAAVGTRTTPDPKSGPFFVRSKDAVVLLATSATVLGVFAVVQLLTIARGSAWVVERTGMTYASYAREGFFQLITVALLVVGAILLTRLLTAADRHRPSSVVCRLVEANAVLVVMLVGVSVRRLDLYEAAFGASLLRTMATWGALVAGVLTVLVAVATSQSDWLRVRLVAAVVGTVAVALLLLAAYDPERRVAERNIDRFEAGAELDLEYLAGLSPDAWQVVERRLPPEFVAGRLDDDRRLCDAEPSSGWFEFELRDRAMDDWWADRCTVAAAARGEFDDGR